MPAPWTPEEVAATVADYLEMLDLELRGQPYSKADHNRRLQRLLNDRSKQAIEFKHANISAILIELGFPYIDGYKPRGNYQELLKEEVVARLLASGELQASVQSAVSEPLANIPPVPPLAAILVDPPAGPAQPRSVYERAAPSRPRAPINYLEREARNASLGRAGEEFALKVEHRRLWEAGERRLAEKVEHVSRTRGDGLGYDIHSFEAGGKDRLIEVKTTAFGQMTPFFASASEVTVSRERAEEYVVYRLFKFRDQPRLMMLPGALTDSCELEPVSFRAAIRVG